MEIIDNTAVKLTVPEHIVSHITSNIEKCEVLEHKGNLTDLVVFWGVDEMTRLNQLISFRNNLPSPIVRDYDWPGIYKPFEHQRVTQNSYLSIIAPFVLTKLVQVKLRQYFGLQIINEARQS
jgi:hypothetical protein